jgi:hypothetical protein
MSAGQHMEDFVPGFLGEWDKTPGWRLTRSEHCDCVDAEDYVRRCESWSDDPDGGYFGGSTAMAAANWLHNDWQPDEQTADRLRTVACRHGKRIPRRSFRRFAFVGLDMVPNHGTHASGAGNHISGFTDSVERDTRVRLGWKTFYEAAAARGSRIVNLSPGTGLMEIPRIEPPERWLVS